MAIARLKCIDPEGIPHRTAGGLPTEGELMHASVVYRFEGGEEIYLDAETAQWLAERPSMRGRLELGKAHQTVETVIIDGKVMILDKDTRKPIEPENLDASKITPRKKGPGGGVKKSKDGALTMPHPPESIQSRLQGVADEGTGR